MKGCFCGLLGAKKDVIVNIGPHVMIFDFYDVCDKASARSTLRFLNALATSILQRYTLPGVSKQCNNTIH